MRARRPALAACAALLAASFLGEPARGAPRAECGRIPSQTSVLAARGPALVYVDDPSPVTTDRRAVIGCWRPTGRRTRLGTTGLLSAPDETILRLRSFAFAGEHVAYVVEDNVVYSDPDDRSRVEVVDLRRGVLRGCSATTTNSLLTVRTAANGATAWITGGEIHALDGVNHERIVARTRGRITALRFRGDRLRYRLVTGARSNRLRPLAAAAPSCEASRIPPRSSR